MTPLRQFARRVNTLYLRAEDSGKLLRKMNVLQRQGRGGWLPFRVWWDSRGVQAIMVRWDMDYIAEIGPI